MADRHLGRPDGFGMGASHPWLLKTRWGRSIERGYDDDIYECTNDLYCRNWLHEAWLLLDEHIVQLWTQQIRALDDRYRVATVDDDGHGLGQFHKLPGPDLWWWRRYPRVLTGDLGRSLRSVQDEERPAAGCGGP
ncbi:hypothetical protein [Streptomyces sp. NPDC049040]|uniref:hypothetical protein n=1 Tax=Streptomyces sp. NPDC049040 TaxID=3365593 RepID=UPI003711D1ED